ncbi:MAG: hypothetical protein P1U68_16395 [Verrucomicrobiales bacterium]|nr:hypothetical protein [Verrucomicrobiales bacterium]
MVIPLLSSSCSKPEGTTAKEDVPKSPSENIASTSFADLNATSPGEVPAIRTLVEPDIGLTGPVHESPGIVDNREAQVALELLKMENGAAKSLALTELFRRWSEEDLDAAMQILPYVENDIENKRAFFRGVAPELLDQDPERLLEITTEHWWQGQWEAYVEAMKKVADSNLDLAIDHFTNTVEGKQYPYLAEKIARNLMTDRSFEEAEAFALSIERPDARGMAMQGIFNRWARQDPVAASASVNELSDPMLKDYAILGMIQQTAGESPGESLIWTMTMQEGKVRTNAVTFLTRRWKSGANEQAYEQLMRHPGLTAQEREAIHQVVEE